MTAQLQQCRRRTHERDCAWVRGRARSCAELHQTVEQFIPPPLDLAKLPKEVRDHYVSYLPDLAQPRSERQASATMAVAKKPTYALYVYPREDLWSGDKLGHFVHEIEQRVGGGGEDSDSDAYGDRGAVVSLDGRNPPRIYDVHGVCACIDFRVGVA